MKIRKIAAGILSFIAIAQLMPVSASEPVRYSGEGMCISVIDNGFKLDHSVFTLKSITRKHTKDTSDALSVYTAAGAGANTGISFFVSDKIPFAYDYGDRDGDVYLERFADDGNAMMSIAAGNIADPSSGYSGYVGTAPEAQLLAMKVYSEEKGGVSGDAIRDAILDSVTLGADVILINISVIGGLSYDESMSEIHGALKKAEENGIVVVCPAGDVKEYGKDSIYDEAFELLSVPTTAPDRGSVAWPGTDTGVLSVASAAGNTIVSDCLTLSDGTRIPYSDNNAVYKITEGRSFAAYFDGRRLEYVRVNGIGTPEELSAAGDLNGKLAVVDRGTISFSEKAKNAAALGAVGVIVVDNQSVGVETLMTLTDLTDAPIPLILVSQKSGAALTSAKEKTVSVRNGDTFTTLTRITPNISSFSAFGTSADLLLKPDVAAVGENVVFASADGGYKTVSSTIAAAARVAGICASVKQRVVSILPELSGEPLARTVKAMVVGSAGLSTQTLTDAPHSPRAQGGGVADLGAALSTDFILTFDGDHKASLGDGLDRFIQFSVTATNLSSETKSCTLDAIIGSDGYRTYRADQLEYVREGETPIYEKLGYNADDSVSFVGDFVPFTETGVTVSTASHRLNLYSENYSPFGFTLAPGESQTFGITVYIDKAEHDTYSEVFENGFFVEGFIRLMSEDSLCTAPFLGFVGDFSESPVLDADMYAGEQAVYGERYVYRYLKSSNSEDLVILGEVAENEDGEPVYDSNKLYFSPKTDKYNSTLMLNFALLRTVGDVRVTVTDPSGAVVSQKDLGTAERTYLSAFTGMTETEQLPLWNGRADDNFAYVYPDGRYTVTVSYRMPSGYARESFSYEILLDTTAPEIKVGAVELEEYTCHLKLDITDNFEVVSVKVEDSDENPARLEADGRYNISLCTGKYIYIDAYDRIGNRNVVRIKNPVYVGAED